MTKKKNEPKVKAVQVKPAKKKTMVEEIAELKKENTETKARVKALEDETGIAGPKGDVGAMGPAGPTGKRGAGFWGQSE